MQRVFLPLILGVASALTCSAEITKEAKLNPRNHVTNLSDPLSLVNLFIGTTNGGNVFPGMYTPYRISFTLILSGEFFCIQGRRQSFFVRRLCMKLANID